MRIKSASYILVLGFIFVALTLISLSLFSLSKTNDLQGDWDVFEGERNVRLNALITLRTELGYGGMIHKFKNYILRQNRADANTFLSSIGGARAALNRYKSFQLNMTEERGLLHIENTLDAYDNAISLVNELIQENKSISEIDQIVKINDTLAVEALKSLELEAGGLSQQQFMGQGRPLLLSKLRTLMGYGGLIHHFKNNVLRNTAETLKLAQQEANAIRELIKQYKHQKLNNIEVRSLQKINHTVTQYQQKLVDIQQLHREGNTIKEIDKAVAIDDTLALEALTDLHRQLISQNEERAQYFSDNLKIVSLSGKVIFLLTVISFVMLISLAIWLLYYQINKPLSTLNSVMKRLSEDELDIEIEETKSITEIGDMARSVEIFKYNAIEKRSAEETLKQLNDSLEERVAERTKELQANQQRLESLVENAVDAIITITEAGIVQTFNSAAIAMFGYKAQEVVGLNVKMLMPEPYKANHDGFLANYMRTGEKKIIGLGREVEALRKNGDIFPMELAVSEIDVREGERIFTGIIRDVSEKKEIENRLREKVVEAEKANKAKSEFLSSMSHELRTPMNAVLGFSQLLESDTTNPLSDDQLESLSYIRGSGQHLLKLIDDVLDLSKIESGHAALSIETVNVNTLVSQITTLIKPEADKSSIKLVNMIMDEPQFLIQADVKKLKQVMLNFASNAIKYNSDKGTVTFTCSQTSEDKVRLSVSDMGEGIEEDSFVDLFEPFNRLGQENSAILGTGIGLTISKNLVELMDGEIGVCNNPEKGATFWVEFISI